MNYITIPIVSGLIFMVQLAAIGQQCDSSSTVQEDSLVYELFVSDVGYASWLSTNAMPANFYSNEYYQQWNLRYVTEWNNRVTSGLRPILYDNIINYDQNVNYPLEVNYKLYNYFLFFEDINHETLIYRKGN